VGFSAHQWQLEPRVGSTRLRYAEIQRKAINTWILNKLNGENDSIHHSDFADRELG
jgi:hypothetical protein